MSEKIEDPRADPEATLKRRGSGISLSLNKQPSRGGSRPQSLDRNGMREFHDWQQQYGGYPPMQAAPGPYPILVNPPPMPTVRISLN